MLAQVRAGGVDDNLYAANRCAQLVRVLVVHAQALELLLPLTKLVFTSSSLYVPRWCGIHCPGILPSRAGKGECRDASFREHGG